MSESFLEVTPGSGLKLHTDSKTVGANTVHDQFILRGMPFLATYGIVAGPTSAATLDSHLMQVMAGASLNVYLLSARIYQAVAATTVAHAFLDVVRLSTAGTGGSSVTPALFDTTDGAAGATAMVLPTAKGTEGTTIGRAAALFTQTITAASPAQPTLLYEWNWEQGGLAKCPRIPAGTANGFAFKLRTAVAAASVYQEITILEANF